MTSGTIRFCVCGRVWPCAYKEHEIFDAESYHKKYLVKKIGKYSGYSEFREKAGMFQSHLRIDEMDN